MTKLKVAQIKERNELTGPLREKYEAIEAAVDEFNNAQALALEKVNEAIAAYNEALDPVREWVAGIKGDIEMFIDDKSEKWQEGERGQAVIEWKDQFENIELDDVSIDEPDTLEFDEENHADLVDELPEEASV